MGIHTRTSSSAAVVFAAFSSLALIAGCGTSGGSDEETTPTASETTTTAAPTSAPAEEPTTAPAETATPEATATASAAPSEEASEEPVASEPAPVAGCTAADLSATIETPMGAGTAGTPGRNLILANISDATCTMTGYPGVSYIDAANAQVGAPANREPGVNIPTVTLEPGQSAIASLQQTNAQNYGADCQLTNTVGVLVYPPEATDAVVAPQESVGCAAGNIILMTVGPVVSM